MSDPFPSSDIIDFLVSQGDVYWQYSPETQQLFISPNIKTLLGYQEDELEVDLETWASLVHPDDFQNSSIEFAKLLCGEADRYQCEIRVQKKDGSYLWLLDRSNSVKNANGHIELVVGTHIDISRSKQDQLKLLETQQYLEKFQESLPIGVVIQDANSKLITYANAAARTILHMTMDQLTGRTSYDPEWEAVSENGTPLPGDQHPAMLTLEDGLPRQNTIMGLNFHDDYTIWISVNTMPVFNSGRIASVVATFNEITELKQVQSKVSESLEELKTQKRILDSHSIVAITDVTGTINYVNDKFCEISGYSRNELLGQNHRVLKSGFHGLEYYKDMYATITRGEIWKGEFCNRAKDGHLYWVDSTIFPAKGESGKPIAYYAIRNDITPRKLGEMALKKSEENIRTILELAGDGIHVTDMKGNIIDCSQSLADMLGYTKEEVLCLNIAQFNPAIDPARLEGLLQHVSSSTTVFETKHRRKDGSEFDVEVHTKGIQIQGESYIYASSRDITARIKAQQEISKLAMTDQLTGLANRNLFNRRFSEAIALANREKTLLAMLMIDLDRFKQVNDTHGHLIGDLLLKEVAQRFKKHTRDTDVLARLGGDEFALLMVNVDGRKNANKAADRLISEINAHFEISDIDLSIGVSIGIAFYPDQAQSAEELIKHADDALYRAKSFGRNCYQVHE